MAADDAADFGERGTDVESQLPVGRRLARPSARERDGARSRRFAGAEALDGLAEGDSVVKG